ncbi:protein of unknown function [Taphrina deformans PYCC 5710]|uniref:SAC domain-containing protein n=1 Tax=Taphrina deformans (strain PYCC 5710 / ATCC 11124 / CBS 356.35 / IMI 108563 / JCM 9778 / NBRC 8474) TaxID=1097556 RepID=R4XDH4_TAPDE|nr:protein of unknown function [Taphrina deformans PYCC 5710]|eukprot:CCG83890.1 protein of unknown function [Taphrina deformans PYCC 5710]
MTTNQSLTGFRIYETATRYYIIGHTQDELHFSIIKIDRTVAEQDFVLEEDEAVYDKVEVEELLSALAAGNSASGGLQHLETSCGLIGLIRFTANYYLSIITKRTAIALLGGHYVYHIDDTKLISLTSVDSVRRTERQADEARYLAILNGLEIGKTFYFSNTYDITHSLQYNLTSEKSTTDAFLGRFNEMFVWNHYLLKTAFSHLRGHSKWCVPIIHGFIDQAKLSIFGKSVYITLIARRSRHFAGARFLKRGANEKGFVANDVETEQIISEQLITPFHNAKGELCDRYTSFVQHRGSIPLNWTQNVDGVNPKPPIELNVVDPFFSAAALHFDHMFSRYGTPVVVINLVKARERTPRETLLLKEFSEAIAYLNQFIPAEHKLRYVAWDMSRASKSRDQEVIGTLEKIAQDAMTDTKFFHSGEKNMRLQSGVSRTNCIDCLDRTNAAQFVIGKHAMSMQLHALGLVPDPSDVKYDCDAVSMMIEMYHDHGDTIALQYGGSHLVNTMETYRKLNQWHSHSRDMIESIRRFYHNSFLDAQRQDAINLFLGNFRIADGPGAQNLWDMENDYRLHYNNAFVLDRHRDYRQWWTPKFLERPKAYNQVPEPLPSEDARYWQEYYRMNLHSHLKRHFCFHMNDTVNYHPSTNKYSADAFDPSPFVVRAHGAASTTAVIKSPRHKVDAETKMSNSKGHNKTGHKSKLSLHRWLGHASYEKASGLENIMNESKARVIVPSTASKSARHTGHDGLVDEAVVEKQADGTVTEVEQLLETLGTIENSNRLQYEAYAELEAIDLSLRAEGNRYDMYSMAHLQEVTPEDMAKYLGVPA